MKPLLPLRSYRSVIRLAWDIASTTMVPLLVFFLLRVANAMRPGLSAFIGAGFVNTLIQAQGRKAVIWAVAFAVVQVVELLTDLFGDPIREWLRASATLRVQQTVLARASSTWMIRFCNPEFCDRLSRASHDIDERIIRWIDSVMHVFHSVTSVIGLIGAVLALGGGLIFIIILIVGSGVEILVTMPLTRLELGWSQRTARPRRIAKAWSDLLSTRSAASEVRLFALQEWIRDRWSNAYQLCAREDIRRAKGRLMWSGVSTVVSVIAYGAILIVATLISLNAGPGQAAGVFTGLLMTTGGMHGYLRELLRAANRLHEQSTLIDDLTVVLTETEDQSAPPTMLPDRPVRVRINNVSFRYPASYVDALREINAQILPGEIVALVGPNGAGKTTLAALLLGLYQPTEGWIEVEGADLNGGPRGSAVFQDFVRYSLPVRDNVGFGDLRRWGDDPALKNALQKAGSKLDNELDTWLGPEFGGRDLSVGEWLRVSLARGLLRQSGLIILDEPTAAVDPLAEAGLIRRLLELGDHRTAIIVSHRLGIARFADRILVMAQGRLIESGTHEELLEANGLYAQMWRAQSSWYTVDC